MLSVFYTGFAKGAGGVNLKLVEGRLVALESVGASQEFGLLDRFSSFGGVGTGGAPSTVGVFEVTA